MRIKTQFLISIITFSIVLIIIGASIALTQQQIATYNSQEVLAHNIQTGAIDLNYISNNYFLYQNDSSIGLWHANFTALYGDLATLNDSSQQKSLIGTVGNDMTNLDQAFAGVVSFLNSAPRNVSVRILPSFQTQWNLMAAQTQILSYNSQQLSQAIREQTDEAIEINSILTVALLSVFAAFFITVYLITFRRTLNSISKLKDGIQVIGSGKLDYSIEAGEKDEISDISKSINQMAANLKTVTSSKTDLEKEIKERKMAEEALIESEERLKRSQEIAHLGSWELDLINDKLTWSDEVYRIFGLKPQEFGATYEAFLASVHPDDRGAVDCAYSGSLAEGRDSYEIEHRVIRKDNSDIRFVHEKCTHLRNASGQVIRSIGMVHDITERKKTEDTLIQRNEELERLQVMLEEKAAEVEKYAARMEELAKERAKKLQDAERLAAIGATAGMVGHDIRNPLQAMIGDVYLAKSDLENMPEGTAKEGIKESLDSIEKNTEYVNKIVADLQDYARPLTPTAKETDIEAILNDALFKKAIPSNIEVSHNVEANAKKAIGDPDMLKRILANLVNNAVQAMPNGGKLAIQAYRRKKDLVITVEDTGVGISEEFRSKLFTPLFTTKSKGQGFGLAVVKRLTEALGGNVTFESEIGKGTKFIVHLPQKKA